MSSTLNDNKRRIPYWLIYSKKKNAIWKHEFSSGPSAVKELDTQMAKLPQDERLRADWRIEECSREVDEDVFLRNETQKEYDKF